MSRNPMPAGRHYEVVTRDRYTCQAPFWDWEMSHRECAGRLVVHHLKPKGMGGSRDPQIHASSNLLSLCDRHHTHIHSHSTRSYETGLLIRKVIGSEESKQQ
jgi:hypothetical protein